MKITEDIATPRRESEVTAWVNAIYGCNEKCTYCVVPFTRWGGAWSIEYAALTTNRLRYFLRGQEQSRKADDIRKEMLSLGEAGYREVTLLGQNIDAYGRSA